MVANRLMLAWGGRRCFNCGWVKLNKLEMLMDTKILKGIAKKVLDRKGQADVRKLIRKGSTTMAKVRLIGAIDIGSATGAIPFMDAAEFYNLLEQPARLFPQKNANIGCL